MKANWLMVFLLIIFFGCQEHDTASVNQVQENAQKNKVLSDDDMKAGNFLISYNSFFRPLTTNREKCDEMIEILSIKYAIQKDSLNRIIMQYLKNTDPLFYTFYLTDFTSKSFTESMDVFADSIKEISNETKLSLHEIIASNSNIYKISEKDLSSLLYDFYIWKSLSYVAIEIEYFDRSQDHK